MNLSLNLKKKKNDQKINPKTKHQNNLEKKNQNKEKVKKVLKKKIHKTREIIEGKIQRS